jgi:ABC-type multidrug transport system fused ATPase/permease subunit
VSFGYDPGRPVLTDVSFSVEPGQLVGLVGPIGSGKSTLVSLIPRFYDPDSGAVTIDGVDVREFTIRSLRRQIAFVLQERTARCARRSCGESPRCGPRPHRQQCLTQARPRIQ